MSTLSDAVTSLQAIQTDDADVQAQVATALTAVQTALAGEGIVDPNDAIVTGIVAVLTGAGYTVTEPTTPVVTTTTITPAELPSGTTDTTTAPAATDVTTG